MNDGVRELEVDSKGPGWEEMGSVSSMDGYFFLILESVARREKNGQDKGKRHNHAHQTRW